MEGAVASRLARSTPERAVRVRALAGDIVLCSWARNFTLTVPHSTQVYKWVLANCWSNLTNCGEVTCDGLASRPGKVEILLAASCYRNRDKLRQPVLAPSLRTACDKLTTLDTVRASKPEIHDPKNCKLPKEL